jgi:putative ABC transport system permease protein
MTTIDLVRLSYGNLLRTRGRAVLTMLGIIIGITSVILMVSIGQAAQNFLLSQVANLGSDLIFVSNGSGDEADNGPPDMIQKQTLTERDYVELRRQPWVDAVDANSISSDVVTYGPDSMFAQIWGSTEDAIRVYPAEVAEGRFLLRDDIDSRARVAVIGQNVAKKLFAEQSPIGRLIKIKRQNFRVVGVMEKGGTRFFTKLDDVVYLPVSATLDLYNRNRLNFITFKPMGLGQEEVKEETRLLMRDTHKLDNPNGILSKDDFRLGTQEEAAASAGVIGQILQILLGSVAAISLVVAGIGIMNIMYVTVTERTAEIGLRKAIGAKQSDILGQFLAEALMLTLLGGAIGVVCGIGLSKLTVEIIGSFQDGWSFTLPLNGIFLAFGVSAAIGIVFGYFPARKAAKLHPIEALRYE